MQITPSGRVIGGVGQLGVWDRSTLVIPAPAGQAGSRSDHVALYQTGEGHLHQYDLQTGQDTELDRLGVTSVRGGGGHYGCYLDGAGVRTDWGLTVPSGGVLGCADDGTVFVITNDYRDLTAYASGHHDPLWVQTDAFPVVYYPTPQFSALDRLRCVWWNAQQNRIQARGFFTEVAETWGTPSDLFVVEWNGEILLGYHSDRFYLHPLNDRTNGWVVAEGATYYTCGRVLTDGTLLCAYSRNPGESAIVTVDVPLTGRGSLVRATRIPTFGPFTHPVVIVPFKDPRDESGAAAEVVVNMNVQRSPRPYVVATDTLNSDFAGRCVGVYCEDAGSELTRAMGAAKIMGVRVVWANDAQAGPSVPPLLRPVCDQIWLELYQYPSDGGLTNAATRWTAQLNALLKAWSGDIGLIPMFYRMGGVPGLWSEQQALDTLDYLTPLANTSPRIKVIAPFSYRRDNGIDVNPGLLEAFRRLLAAQWHDSNGNVIWPKFNAVPVDPPTPIPPKPEPPKPQPEPPKPQPIPPKPQEPDPMLYSKVLLTDMLKGDLIQHPQSASKKAIRKPNGKYVCVTPDGAVQERPNDSTPVEKYVPGAWEEFTVVGNFLKAERDGGREYAFAYIP